MRIQINLDPETVRALDNRVGRRDRSAFIAESVRRALDEGRREDIEAALGTIADSGHVWDPDAAAWIHAERRRDPRRVG